VANICCFQINKKSFVSFSVIGVEKWCKEGNAIGQVGGEK